MPEGPDPIDAFAAQVKRSGGGFGSGMLIAPGLVLTALHVIFGRERPDTVPQPDAQPDMHVRLVGDMRAAREQSGTRFSYVPEDWVRDDFVASPQAQFLPATLVWPEPGSPFPDDDLAVLKIDEAGLQNSVTASRNLDFDVITPSGREMALFGYGFPQFTVLATGADRAIFREIATLEVTVGGRQAQGVLKGGFDVRVDSSRPDDAHGWKGISGTSLWAESDDGAISLLGVVHDAATNRRDNDALSCWRLDAISDDADFWNLIGREPPASAGPASNRRSAGPSRASGSDILGRFPAFDRTPGTGAFTTWLRNMALQPGDPLGREDGTPRPMVISIEAHRVDQASRFVQTLTDLLTLHVYRDTPEVLQKPVFFGMDETNPNLNQRKSQVLTAWADGVGGPPGDIFDPPDKTIRNALADESLRRSAVVEHQGPEFADDCAETLEAVVQVLSGFTQPAEQKTPPVLFVSLINGSEQGDPDSAYLPAQEYGDKCKASKTALTKLSTSYPTLNWCIDLPPLSRERCRMIDFNNWLNTLGTDGMVLPPELPEYLRDACAVFDEFPMQFASEALRGALDAVERRK